MSNLETEYKILYKKLQENGPSDELRKDFITLRETYLPDPKEWMSLSRDSLDKLLENVLGVKSIKEGENFAKYARSQVKASFGIQKNNHLEHILRELSTLYNCYNCLYLVDVFFIRLKKILDIETDGVAFSNSTVMTQDAVSIDNSKISPEEKISILLNVYLKESFARYVKYNGSIDFEYLVSFTNVVNENFLKENSANFYKDITKLLAANSAANSADITFSYQLLKRYSCLRMATSRLDTELEVKILRKKLFNLIEKHPIQSQFDVQKMNSIVELQNMINEIINHIENAAINPVEQKMLKDIMDDDVLSLYFITENTAPNSMPLRTKNLSDTFLKSLKHEKIIEFISHRFLSNDYLCSKYRDDIRRMPLEELTFLQELITSASSSGSDSYVKINKIKYDISCLKENIKDDKWRSIAECLKNSIDSKGRSSSTSSAIITSSSSSRNNKSLASTVTRRLSLKFW